MSPNVPLVVEDGEREARKRERDTAWTRGHRKYPAERNICLLESRTQTGKKRKNRPWFHPPGSIRKRDLIRYIS